MDGQSTSKMEQICKMLCQHVWVLGCKRQKKIDKNSNKLASQYNWDEVNDP